MLLTEYLAYRKEDAISYAFERGELRHGEIRVLNADGLIKGVIRLDGSTRKL